MLHEFKDLEISALYDLLATYTTKYTRMLRHWGPTLDFKECEEYIAKLHTEIDSRIILEKEDVIRS
ncbi:MAG TPA: hypothetical protein VGZ90_02330 [Puia sp.]|jgi:hypothetical protein|nr:hypothetical protein [Puia sp.]